MVSWNIIFIYKEEMIHFHVYWRVGIPLIPPIWRQYMHLPLPRLILCQLDLISAQPSSDQNLSKGIAQEQRVVLQASSPISVPFGSHNIHFWATPGSRHYNYSGECSTAAEPPQPHPNTPRREVCGVWAWRAASRRPESCSRSGWSSEAPVAGHLEDWNIENGLWIKQHIIIS